jgi:hypothetical protein
MGKFLIITGIILIVAGVIIHFFGRVPPIGRLPGDIKVEGKNYTLYAPIMTSILISMVLSLLFYVINKLK